MGSSKLRNFLDGLIVRSTHIRRFLAELLGSFLFVAFAKGSLAQVIFANSEAFPETDEEQLDDEVADNHAQTINVILVSAVGEGLALTVAMYAAGRVSGGHINPIVSLTAAVQGSLTIIELLVEWLAQYFGAYLAANCVYLLYRDASVHFVGNQDDGPAVSVAASVYASHPQNYAGLGQLDDMAFGHHDFRWGVTSINVVLNSALFVLIYSGFTDKNNTTTEFNHIPFLCGLVLTVLNLALGFNCGTAINPAIDFAGRVFSSTVGWSFNLHQGLTLWWFWMPVILPHLGALIGFVIYQLCIGNHLPRADTSSKFEPFQEVLYFDDDDTLLVQRSEVRRAETERTSHVRIIC